MRLSVDAILESGIDPARSRTVGVIYRYYEETADAQRKSVDTSVTHTIE